MSRIFGILIAYPPTVITKSEGLSRLLAFLIQGVINSGNKIMIICPEWSRKDLIDIFKDANISDENISIITTGDNFPILRVNSWFANLKHRKPRSSIIKRFLIRMKEQAIAELVKMAGTKSIILFTVLLVIGILLLPVFILIAIIYITISIILASFKNNNHNNNNTHTISLTRFWFIDHLGSPLIVFQNNQIVRQIFNYMLKQEYNKIADLANNQNEVKSWLVPAAYWPELTNNVQKTVIVCPDIVMSDYPVGFECEGYGKSSIAIRSQMDETLRNSSHIITYSNYVKNNQVIARMGISKNKITVIPHGHISLVNSLNILKPFENLNAREKQVLCIQIVHDYLHSTNVSQYLRNFDFSGVRFIFYPSQVRPHKNIPMLIRALHTLLHKKNEPIKLILTGRANEFPYTSRVISELGVSRDVVVLPGLPSQVMAAFYHLSTLAVNPTLFEGGFPFTFSEAYSVGTPSIFSRIPVVEECITDPELQKKILFNPYSLDDIVEHICWGLHHRDELLALERPLYEQLKERSWAQVAQEYWNVIDQVDASSKTK